MLDGCGPVFEGEDKQREYECEKVGRNHKEVPKPRRINSACSDGMEESKCNNCTKADVCKYKEQMNEKRLDLDRIGLTEDGPFRAYIVCKYFQMKQPMIVSRSKN